MDNNRNKNIKISKNLTGDFVFTYTPKREYSTYYLINLNKIKPLKREGTLRTFATIDIETITPLALRGGLNGLQVPLLIAFSSHTFKNKNQIVETKTFLIEKI